MAIDKSMLSKLAALSDEEMRDAVRKAAKLLGASDKDAERAAGTAPLIKAKLSSATDADIKRAIDHVGEDTIRDIAKEIGIEKGQG